MARKSKETLKEAPPPADSSSEEEVEEEEHLQEEHPEHEVEEEEAGSSDGEEESSEDEDGDDDDDDEEDDENPPSTPLKTPTSKKPNPNPNPNPTPNPTTATKTKPTESSSDSDSDTDSDSSPPFKVKPLPSKPMNNNKPKEPRSKPTTVAALAATGSKRSLSDDGAAAGKTGGSKKAKKDKEAAVDEGAVTEENSSKKQLFQRLWSDEDEILILKGMIEYKNKKGDDPVINYDDFVAFVHKHFKIEYNRSQIVSKVRRLKRKYLNALKKKKITDSHELNCLELSKQIWGIAGGASNNGDVVEDHKDITTPVKGSKVKGKGGSKKIEDEKEQTVENGKDLDEMKKVEKEGEKGVVLRSMMEIGIENGAKEGLLNDAVVKEGLMLVKKEKRAELEEKWRKFNILELEISSKRLELYRESVQMALEALKSVDQE